MRRNLHVVFPTHVGMNRCVALERWLKNRFPRSRGVGSSKHQNRETKVGTHWVPTLFALKPLPLAQGAWVCAVDVADRGG